MCIEIYDPNIEHARTVLTNTLWVGFAIMLIATVISFVKKYKWRKIAIIALIIIFIIALISIAEPDIFIHACG